MEYTEHYNLKMPQTTDPVRVDDFNENTQEIEDILVSMEISQDTAEEIFGANGVPQNLTTDSIISTLASRDYKMEVHTGYDLGDSDTATFELSFFPKFLLICGTSISGIAVFHDGNGYGTCSPGVSSTAAMQVSVNNLAVSFTHGKFDTMITSAVQFVFFG